MTIMLKNGKKALLDDLRSNILSQGQIALSSAISTCGMSEYIDKIPIAIHNNYNENKSVDLIHFLKEYNTRLSQNLAKSILTTLDNHLYTQEEMETDLGLNK